MEKMKKKLLNKKVLIIAIAIIVVVIAVTVIVVLNQNKNQEEEILIDPESGAQITAEGKRIDQSDDDKLDEIMNGGTKEEPESYNSNVEYTEDVNISNETYTSTGFEENAILVSDGVKAIFNNITITREAEDSDDETGAKMFGIGAALLAKNSTVSVSNSTITTSGKGATGVFSYGTGVVLLSNTIITTNGNNAGGIHTSQGGTVSATNVTVTTNGENSAAVRSEADGQVMNIEGGTYTTYGQDSPAIYSLAEVMVKNATMVANNSEVAYIDGGHSITLEDCDLTGNMMYVYNRYHYGYKSLAWTVGIAQTMQKDNTAIGTFKMSGGSLTSQNGGMFYTSNTQANIVLKGVKITPSESNDFFLKCTGNNNTVEENGIWGTVGNNGATCNFTAIEQEMIGDVLWDSISQLDFYLTDSSKLTGAIIDDETCVVNKSQSAKPGYCDVYIGKDSTWIVTGDSTVSTLSSEGKIVDESGNKVTIKGTDGTTYVNGNSKYTITVDKYETTVDLNGALSF